jgi:sodium transport system permease protein
VDFGQILAIYRHEVRSALRERNIVIYSIVLPIVMYPAMLWAMFAGISFVQGQSDRLSSRVALVDLPAVHQEFADSLEADDDVALTSWTEGRDEAVQRIAAGRLDALVEFGVPERGGGLSENFNVLVSFNEARDRSATARRRIDAALDRYRLSWLDRERQRLGVSDAAWDGFGIVRNDVATREDISRFILGLLVPVLTMFMVALAAFYPAIDATAGERERSTWETLMTVAASRSTVASAKYFYVATFGLAGGLLNLFALALSMRWILSPLAGDAVDELVSAGIPWSAFPVIALGTALLALFISAIMLVLAAFARTFKEGQSMITPFYLLMIMPAVFMQSPDMEFTTGLAVTPVANVIMLIREAIMGTYALPQMGLTFASMTLVVVLSIAFAQWVMRKEEVFMGTHEGGLGKFLKSRLRSRRAEA